MASVPVTPVSPQGHRPGPHAPISAHSHPHPRPRHQPAPANSGGGKEVAIVVGLVLLLAAGGVGVWFAASKAEEKKKAVAAAPTIQDQAREKMAALALKDAERRDREAGDREKAIAQNRADIAKREKEDAARLELELERDAKLTKIANEYFNGDKVAAAELLKEAEAVNEEINKLFADNVQGNEPRTQAEFHQTWTRLFERRIKSNSIIAKARAGAVEEFLSESPGQAFTKNSELLEKYGSFGSGFFIAPDGWLVTNRHVVRSAEKVDLRTSGGEVISAKVIARDPDNDLALLKATSSPRHGCGCRRGRRKWSSAIPSSPSATRTP
jgi:S1-C subfamily serine protease